MWDIDISKKHLKELFGLGAEEGKLGIFSTSVIISVSNISKGWDWMLEQIEEVVNIKGEFSLRTKGSKRALLTTKDERAIRRLLRVKALENGEF